MLWAMFCWETLGPGIHVDVPLTYTTHLKIVTHYIHRFMAQGSLMTVASLQKKIWNNLRSMTQSSRSCLGLKNSPDLSPI